MQSDPTQLDDPLIQMLANGSPAQFRYERKFRIEGKICRLLDREIRQHSSGFRTIYHPRDVNSIYLDTFDRRCLRDNLDGKSDRTKVRIRWYGDLQGPVAAQLEFKIRRGQGITKYVYPLPALIVTPELSLSRTHKLFKKLPLHPGVHDVLRSLRFAVIVRYHRAYYLSADGRFRATTDEGVTYHRVGRTCLGSMASYTDHAAKILELKYAVKDEPDGGQVGADFPFRMTRNSKYVNGMTTFS